MNDESPQRAGRPKRSGGRAARTALRAAKLADDLRPIRAGMSGGTYKPLSDADIAAIYEAALVALEEIGLIDAPQSGVDVMVKAGAQLGDDGLVLLADGEVVATFPGLQSLDVATSVRLVAL